MSTATMQTTQDIASGLMNDGEHPFVSGINCWTCGKFVGRDGWIEIEHFEMSSAVASVSGQCHRCVRAEVERETAQRQAELQKAADEWNAKHPIGTPVMYWPGTRDDHGRQSTTRTPAWVIPSGAALVSVVGYPGGISLTHVDPIEVARA